MSSKKNRRWGLLGLLGLGSLFMMGAAGRRSETAEDDEPTTGGGSPRREAIRRPTGRAGPSPSRS